MAIEQQRLARPNPTPGPFGVQSASGMPATTASLDASPAAAPNPLQAFVGGMSPQQPNLMALMQALGGQGGSLASILPAILGALPGMVGISPAMTPSTATPPAGNILPQTQGSTPALWTNLPMMGLSGGSGMVLG